MLKYLKNLVQLNTECFALIIENDVSSKLTLFGHLNIW